ncbi:MAG: hypothetical protein FJX29_09885 [Alphaproteobacteria bacterium]|nr:hypothetical protein [Alphaproteobacteria bacterium]
MNWQLGGERTNPRTRAALRRIKGWVHENFRLSADDTVSVNEVACQLPGCPPIETVIVFWTREGAMRHHYKVFKPAVDVVAQDLPPWWMKDALAVSDDFECSCC